MSVLSKTTECGTLSFGGIDLSNAAPSAAASASQVYLVGTAATGNFNSEPRSWH